MVNFTVMLVKYLNDTYEPAKRFILVMVSMETLMKEDKVSRWSTNSPEQLVTDKGWVKIHHQDYGYLLEVITVPVHKHKLK